VLSGITVLDISEYIAGPHCGSLLADLGARVIKVEPPDGAEERRLGSRERYRGNTRMALAYNRGKQSLALDLRRPEGRAVLYRLVPQADVVIQNFPPSVAKKLGIDYEAVRPDKGAPVLGQDSADVLAEAGFGLDEIAALQRAEIVK
jgi:formyl-CoA transferase